MANVKIDMVSETTAQAILAEEQEMNAILNVIAAASIDYSKVKDYYDKGLWSAAQVRNAVVKGWITAEEFAEITGEDYE